jgi:hypothetical protein
MQGDPLERDAAIKLFSDIDRTGEYHVTLMSDDRGEYEVLVRPGGRDGFTGEDLAKFLELARQNKADIRIDRDGDVIYRSIGPHDT